MNDVVKTVLKHRGTESTVLVMILAGALTFMDERHAMAADFQLVVSQVQQMRVDDIESDIEEAEDTIDDIMFIPEVQRTSRDKRDLRKAETRKERYLRKLKSIYERITP